MNSQPRHGAPNDRGLECRRCGRLVAGRCLEGRWTPFGWLALAGTVVLIGCGRVGDSPSAAAPSESSPNESQVASTPLTVADRPTMPTPFAAAYEIPEVLPFSVKRLKALLRAHDIGILTLKKRGFAADLDRLRRDLRPSGTQTATVVLTRVGDDPVAIFSSPMKAKS